MSGSPWPRPSLWIGLILCVLGGALSVPPWRSLIEQSMVWHMVVQMPMLVAGGWLLAGSSIKGLSTHRFADWNQYGLTGFIAGQLIAAY
jgi:hypothetical protein